MAYTTEENENYQEPQFQGEQPDNKPELLLDRIAESLIQSSLVNTTDVQDNQKFIRNGQLQSGQGSGVLALFQKDIKANQEDFNFGDGALTEIANQITNFDTLLVSINEGVDNGISITLSGGGLSGLQDITELIVQDGTFSNVSQFIPLQQSSSIVDVDKANEFLDTNIFELLPTGDTRQARIIRFFQELNALLPPNLPQFDVDGVPGVDRDPNGKWDGDLEYQRNNSISYAQDNQDGNIDEEDAFIHRLKSTANDTNSSRTIEDIYNTILPYLDDILEDPIELEDIPTYQNQSSGYLQFRNPNQGIIIRNTNQEFVEGLNPSNLTYLDTLDDNGNIVTNGTGFTITMWVRFLDKVSNGTLFNFGNPIKGVNNGGNPDDNAFGFTLETFVLNKNDECLSSGYDTWHDAQKALTNYNTNIFDNSNTARFVRLIVNDNGQIRDSHVGSNPFDKLNTVIPYLNEEQLGTELQNQTRLLNTTFIPQDYREWYFICASFNPNIAEDDSHYNSDEVLEQTPEYWLNHIQPIEVETDGIVYEANSGFGNKCKVEIISRTDLLRARGFKVD